MYCYKFKFDTPFLINLLEIADNANKKLKINKILEQINLIFSLVFIANMNKTLFNKAMYNFFLFHLFTIT